MSSVFGEGDVAQWLERRTSNPKTLGSISWGGRVRYRVFVVVVIVVVVVVFTPPLVQTPICVDGTHPHQFVRTLKIPYLLPMGPT